MRRSFIAVAIAAATVLAGCSSSGDSGAPTDNSATGTGTIRIGIADDLPGVSIKDGDDYSGFDIDTANYVAGRLGVPTKNIVWQRIHSDERVSALTSGRVDLVVSTFSITDDRKKEVDFAGPYFVAHQDLLIRRNDETINGPQTLDGKVVCAASGTTSADYVKANYRGRITIREVPSWSECVRNLVAGDVDVVSTDDLILAGFAAQPQHKGILKVVGKGFTDERYGIGLKKGDNRLDKVRDALKEYISSGEWKKSLDARVAPSGYKIPGAPTVE